MKNNFEKKLRTLLNKVKSANKPKQFSIAMSVLPLVACGGSGGGGSAPATTATPPTPVAPVQDSDFTETQTNIFVALDNLNRTLSEGGNSSNLTVTGKAGNDSITTGSGSDVIEGAAGNDTIISNAGDDFIRGGEGADTINAGAGNDAIVVVGTTSASQYAGSSITNSGGSGIDLTRLISLSDLNGRSVSEVAAGETIDGGSGVNTLYIYGTVDLTGVTLNNVTVMVVNSDVTLTPEQIAAFTSIDGDGNSVINIETPAGSSETSILDLSAVNLTDVGSINIDGDITVVIDTADDIAGVDQITVGTGDEITIKVNGTGSSTNIDLAVIADTFDQVDVIDLDSDVTLNVENASDITNLGLNEVAGDGAIETNGSSDVTKPWSRNTL